METPLSEIIDRITILRLKIENNKDPNNSFLNDELASCEEAVEGYRKRGIAVKQEWFDELYKINKYQWGLESLLREIKDNRINFRELGELYIKIQLSNKKRVAVKNKITEETGSGFKDIKVN